MRIGIGGKMKLRVNSLSSPHLETEIDISYYQVLPSENDLIILKDQLCIVLCRTFNYAENVITIEVKAKEVKGD